MANLKPARLNKLSFGLGGVIKETIEELKKVIWPSRELVFRHSLMVIGSVAVATIIFAGLDLGLQKLVILALERQ